MKPKALVFILDGLGDRPCAELGGQTPLAAAHTPVLDALAAAHQCGLMDPLLPGMPVDTHTGVGVLFGLPPAQAVGLRRGPVEAAGIGLTLRRGDVLLRANFATLTDQGGRLRILDRRAGRIRDAGELCAALGQVEVAPGVVADVHPATQHRAVLRLRGEGLSEMVSDTDPGGGGGYVLESVAMGGSGGVGIAAADDGATNAVTDNNATAANANAANANAAVDNAATTNADSAAVTTATTAAAVTTAAALNHFTRRAYDILATHPQNAERIARGLPPANGVIARSAGVHHPPDNLLASLGLKVAAVAGEMTILGLARLFGFTCLSSPRFTSLPDTDLAEKLRMATRALTDHDLVFVHLKGTDTAAHDRNPTLKAEFISRFDAELGGHDLSAVVVGVCADHSTDSIRGEHNGDPVPVLLTNPMGRRDRVRAYSETAAAEGSLGRITAQQFLTTTLDAIGALDNYKISDARYFRL